MQSAAPMATTLLHRGNGKPLWLQVRSVLEREMALGELLPGQRLPSEQALGRRFGVNRHTVRRALKALQEAGRVRTERGRGTVVAAPSLEYRVAKRTRFTDNMSLNAMRSRSHFLHGDIVAAGEAVAHNLGLAPGARVNYIELFGEAEGKRLFVSSGYFPLSGMENLIEVFRKLGSLTKTFQAMGISDYLRVSSRISTRLSGPEETRLLGLKSRMPLLVVEYVNADLTGRPIEYGLTRFAGDKLEIVVESDWGPGDVTGSKPCVTET